MNVQNRGRLASEWAPATPIVLENGAWTQHDWMKELSANQLPVNMIGKVFVYLEYLL